MAFIQIVECDAPDIDQVKDLTAEWKQSTDGKRTARRILLCEDQDRSGHFYELVFFDSQDSARDNSDLPETRQFAERLSGVLGGEPTFRNLEVVQDLDLS
jgi:hypothetical protein